MINIKTMLPAGLFSSLIGIMLFGHVALAAPIVRCEDSEHEVYGGISSNEPDLLSAACSDLDNEEQLLQSNILISEASQTGAFDMGVTCENGSPPTSEIEVVDGFNVLRIKCAGSKVDKYSFSPGNESQLANREPVNLSSAAEAAQNSASSGGGDNDGGPTGIQSNDPCDADGSGSINTEPERECQRDAIRAGLSSGSEPVPVLGNAAVSRDCPNNYTYVSIAPANDDDDLDNDDDTDEGLHCVPNGDSLETNGIIVLIKGVIRVLAAGVALVVLASLIGGGIQYIAARDNPQMVQKAKVRIFNAIIGFVLYIFAFAILNFLIPGGILG